MKYNPHDYQRYAAEFITTHPIAALLLDMGLGKTLQVIAVLLAHKEENRKDQPALIITPASLVYNWKEEFARYAP